MTMLDDFNLEADEGGLYAVLTLDEDVQVDEHGRLRVWVPTTTALVMHDEVQKMLSPWVAEMEAARATRPPSTAELRDTLDAGVYDHDPGKRHAVQAELERRGA